MPLLRTPLFLTLILLAIAWSTLGHNVGKHKPSISVHLSSGGNDNYLFRDNVTSAQLLLTSANNTAKDFSRLVVALPAGNSGALVYFVPLSSNISASNVSTIANNNGSEHLTIGLVNGSLTSTKGDFHNVGLQADLSFSRNATLGVTIIGAVRAMRDYVEGSGTMHEIFNYTLHSFNSTFVRLHRSYINTTSPESNVSRGADLYLSASPGSGTRFAVTPGHNGTFTPPKINIIVPDCGKNHVRVRVVTNETSLAGLDTRNLFLPTQNGTVTVPGINSPSSSLANGSNAVAEQVAFLSYDNKFTAGGWRFLTYFGRDSMIALRLLMPILTPNAIEDALGAVIERANTTGALCHEETIGDYASFINIQNNRSDLGNQPFYDYKMIDTDLLLLPAVSYYFLELPQGQNRSARFLSRNATLQNGTYADILDRIASYNFARAVPFFQNKSVANLLAFRPGQPVGNWRDSNEGTGYGPIPFDVNTALVPASLRATEQLVQAGIMKQPSVSITMGGQNNVTVGQVAGVWECDTPAMFEVTVDGATAGARLNNFISAANLSQALLSQNGTNSTVGSNVSFYALSLKADGTPVEVLNSDLGFKLMYGTNVSKTFLQHSIDALTPYPRGLLTNIGMVVANPAYDSNTTNIDVLSRAAYHGTVIWSFQQGLMAGGLARQLALCSSNTSMTAQSIPSWCNDAVFVQQLRDAQTRLWTSIRGGQDHIFTEVWSYSFDNTTSSFSVADIAVLSPVGVESDAAQLWSYGFLALSDPSTIGSSSGGNSTASG